MMKSLRFLLSCILVFSLWGQASICAKIPDSTTTIRPGNMTKAEYALYCDQLYTQKSKAASYTNPTQTEIDDLLYQYSISPTLENEKKLNDIGIYIYSVANSVTPLSSDDGDIFLSNVSTSYDSTQKTWTVTAGGYWTDLSGISEESGTWVGFTEGATRNIGGLDALGIAYYNTSGSYPIMKTCRARIGDGTGNFTPYSSPATADSTKGAAFLFQDHIICTEVTSLFSYNWAYFGQMYSITITYDSSFSDFHGVARAFLFHTWEETSITSIELTAGKESFGVSATWTNAGYSFPAYSEGECEF